MDVTHALISYYEGVEKTQIICRLLSSLFYSCEATSVVFVEKSREVVGCFYFHLIGPSEFLGSTGATLIHQRALDAGKRKPIKKWSFHKPAPLTYQVWELRNEDTTLQDIAGWFGGRALETKRNLLVLEGPPSGDSLKSVQVALNTIDNLFYHRQRKRGDYAKERAYHQIVKTMVTPLVIFDVRDVKKHLGDDREEIDPTHMICTFANQSFCALAKFKLDFSEQAYFDKEKNPFRHFLSEPSIFQQISKLMNEEYQSSDSGSLNQSTHSACESHTIQERGGVTLLQYEDEVIPKSDYECFIYRVNGTRAGVVFTDISEKIKQMHLVEQASRAKSEFLANINHEFRTPLNSIDGNLQLLMRTHPFTDRQKDLIHRMRLSSTALMNLLQEILDYAKLEQRHMKLRDEVFSLRHCIQSSVDILASAAQKKRNALNFAIGLEVPTLISGDSFRLQQILVNLLNNAIHYTQNGQINIQVDIIGSSVEQGGRLVSEDLKGPERPGGASASGRPAEGAFGAPPSLQFSVSDTGTGIDEEMQGRLFVPWSHGNPLKLNSGTGLGLAICKELCELMGGKIWLKSSQVGQGSVFVFEIPLRSAENVVTIAESAQKEIQLIRGKQILYFDRDELQRKTVVKCLLSWGVRPTTCSDVEELQGFLQAGFSFDVVFIAGVASCSEEGLQMARWIKGKFPQIPLLGAAVDKVAYDEACLEVFRKIIVAPVDTNHLFRFLVHLSQPSGGAGGSVGGANSGAALVSAQQGEGRLKILVVEDVRENAIMLVEMIRVLGYADVKWVENGQEMLEELKKKEVDVVFVDLLMPVMNGLDAVQKYRKETKKEVGSFPIMVAVTATTLVSDDPKSYHGAGMDAMVQKPVKMQELQTLLEIIQEQKNIA